MRSSNDSQHVGSSDGGAIQVFYDGDGRYTDQYGNAVGEPDYRTSPNVEPAVPGPDPVIAQAGFNALTAGLALLAVLALKD